MPTVLLKTVALFATGLLLAAVESAATPAQAASSDLLVIGDSFTQGVGDRVPDNGMGWSPVAARALGMTLTQDGKGGSGYVNPACFTTCAGTFDQRVYRHPAGGYRTVILQGSTNDKAYLSTLAGNANMTIKAAKRRWPDALLVVVGPVSISGSPDAATVKVNDKLRAAAVAQGVPFVDGIRDGWFVAGDWSRYSDAATGHPNDAGYTVIGRHIAADVERLR